MLYIFLCTLSLVCVQCFAAEAPPEFPRTKKTLADVLRRFTDPIPKALPPAPSLDKLLLPYLAEPIDGTSPLKLLTTSKPHCAGIIKAIAWKPQFKLIAIVPEDETIEYWRFANYSTIKLWDSGTGLYHQTFEGHRGIISSVAWSPCDKYIASGSYDRTIKIWDVHSGECTRSFDKHKSFVFSVAWSPCGKYIAAGLADGTIKLWNVRSGKCWRTFRESNTVITSVQWSPCGTFIIFTSSDNMLRTWRPDSKRCSAEPFALFIHSDNSLAWSPCGNFIAAADSDKTVKLWDLTTGKWLQTIPDRTDKFSIVAWSPCGKFIATGSHDNRIKVWGVPPTYRLDLDQQIALLKAFVFKELDLDLLEVYDDLPEAAKTKLRSITKVQI
jgi:uncharacterized protein with WD repeat